MKASKVLFLVFIIVTSLQVVNTQPVRANPQTIIVPDDYLTIGWAIGNASEGDTIFVKKGTYYEHVFINKSISLIGENRSTTIIDGNGLLEIVNIVAHDVFLSGFTVRNGYRAIVMASNSTPSRYNTIHGCVLRQASFGIILWGEIYTDASGHSYMPSELNVIEENIIETTYAIELGDSHNNKIADNIIENGSYGIYVDGYSHDNLITGNLLQNIRARGEAITLMGRNATIIGNTFKANDWGLFIYGDMPLTHYIYHNNFIANVRHVELLYSPSIVWDSGYPSGGNYWSDFEERYPNATEIDGSGIWDTPYVIDENNQDNYPLVNRYGCICNLDTNLTYLTIQSAIDAPETLDGHTIFVEEGIYYENVVLSRSISLIGENKVTTIIDGNMTATVVAVTADNVTISEFTIRNGGDSYTGITLSSNGNNITSNIMRNNLCGINLEHYSAYNVIADNIVTGNLNGIIGELWSDTTIINNILKDNLLGINTNYCNRNTIAFNNITNHWSQGIMIQFSSYNTIVGNNITDNNLGGFQEGGIYIGYSSHNKFFHNNIIANRVKQVEVRKSIGYPSVNTWDEGYPSGGNYWSDYAGVDLNKDGIGDSPYTIDASNLDNFPLMGIFSSFDAQWGYNVNVISNSTVDDFEFSKSPANITIKMRVSNMTSNQTSGFCRVTIPHALMTEPYSVTVDGAEPNYANYTIHDNNVSRWIYFSYNHSTLEIIIQGTDITPPTISILSPENKTYPTENISLSFTVDEATSWIGYSLNGEANVTITGDTTLILLGGMHYVVVHANDTVGNVGASSTVYFTVDTTSPNIIDVSQTPLEENVLPEDEVKVNATVTDELSGVKQVSLNYTNGDGTWITVNMTNLEGNVWNATIPSFPYGTNVTYGIIAEDNMNNTITTEDLGYEYQYTVIPEFPPWTSILFTFTLLTVSIVIYKRRLLKSPIH